MILSLSNIAAMLVGQVLFVATPSDVIAKNEIEKIVLSPLDSATPKIKTWLAQTHDEHNREQDLIAAGFKRVRLEDVCENYVYSRQLTDKMQRRASIILCNDKPPLVLLFDEGIGPWIAPKPGAPSASVAAPTICLPVDSPFCRKAGLPPKRE